MNKLLLILIASQLTISSQSKKTNLDKKFFLLGVINNPYSFDGSTLDYENFQIDYFHELDKPTLDFIKREVLSDSLIDLKIIGEDLFSKYISKEIPKYTDRGEMFYSEFKSNHEIASFLTGAYLRDGEKINDTIYKIHIPLSKKPSFCFNLLKRVKCKHVFYRKIQNIPTQNIVYFYPSEELREYFSLIEQEPKRIEKIKVYYTKIFSENTKSEKSLKKRKEAKKFSREFSSKFDESHKKYKEKEIDTLRKMYSNRQKS